MKAVALGRPNKWSLPLVLTLIVILPIFSSAREITDFTLDADSPRIRGEFMDERVTLNPLPTEVLSSFERKIVEVIERIRPQIRLAKDFDFDGISDQDLGFGIRWTRGTEPNYSQANSSYLIDEFKLQLGPSGLGIFQNLNASKLGLAPAGEIGVTFARAFPGRTFREQLGMLVQAPYNPLPLVSSSRLPLNAAVAQKLNVDDIVFLKSKLSLVLRGDVLKRATTTLPILTSAYYMVSGEFNVHVYRRPGNKVRVKFIGVRSDGIRTSIGVGADIQDSLKIYQITSGAIRGRLENLTQFTAIELTGWRERGNAFMIDYILDFNNKDVRSAYDAVMSNFLSPRIVRLMNPLQSRPELRVMLVSEIDPLEVIFERDREKNIGDRTVDRPFSGELDYNKSGNQFSLGLREIFQIRLGRSFIENRIYAFDRNNRRRYFLMPVYQMTDSFTGALNYIGADLLRTANLLVETDSSFTPRPFSELSFSMSLRDKSLDQGKIDKLREMVRVRLSESLYEKIDWMSWDKSSGTRINARVNMLMVFRAEAIAWLSNISSSEFSQMFKRYGRGLKHLQAEPTILDPEGERLNRSSRDFETKFKHDIEFISYHLQEAFKVTENPTPKEARERMDRFLEMRRNSLWQEVGSGFLVQIFHEVSKAKYGNRAEEELLKNFYFETQWQAKGEDTVFAALGTCTNRSLYKAMMYLYGAIHDRGFDLRQVDQDTSPLTSGESDAVPCEQRAIP